MALTITTNQSSLIAQANLTKATNALNKSIERMTTGYKINSAKDDAAGYAIVKDWEAQLSSLDVASDNAATGVDLLTTTEESYSLITEHLQRIRDLTEQAANGTYGSDSLRAMQAEISARAQEIDRVAFSTEFNDIYLLKGKVSSTGIDLQVGIESDANSRINLAQDLFKLASTGGLFADQSGFAALMTAAGGDATKLKSNTDSERIAAIEAFAAACVGMKYNAGKIETGNTHKPSEMLPYIDAAISDVSTRVTKIGASQNRVSSAITAINVQSDNLTSSLSTLRDTDVAEESSKYVQEQILQQASASLLATANQMPSIALSLI